MGRRDRSQRRVKAPSYPPVRIPYGRQSIDAADTAAVTAALRSGWLTTGPRVAAFEKAFARFTGAREAVAVANGTAALHAAMHAAGVGPGMEVIVPAMTFAASANCAVFQGAIPRFCDVDSRTLLADPVSVRRLVTRRTKAIVAVDYAGQPCDLDALLRLARRHGLVLVEDAAHSLGARDGRRRVGSIAPLTTFSLHPVKHLTTGEGGMVTTDDPATAARLRRFRNHGISADHHQRTASATWVYEVVDLGYNYRLTDFQCALGLSQLAKVPAWIARRRAIAARYDRAFSGLAGVRPLARRPGAFHSYHLYVVRIDANAVRGGRAAVFEGMRRRGIGVNVHYIPVHLHPFYRRRFGTRPGLCPAAERAYGEILSLPMFPTLGDRQVQSVIDALTDTVAPLLR